MFPKVSNFEGRYCHKIVVNATPYFVDLGKGYRWKVDLEQLIEDVTKGCAAVGLQSGDSFFQQSVSTDRP
jgi:hypothetical protein